MHSKKFAHALQKSCAWVCTPTIFGVHKNALQKTPFLEYMGVHSKNLWSAHSCTPEIFWFSKKWSTLQIFLECIVMHSKNGVYIVLYSEKGVQLYFETQNRVISSKKEKEQGMKTCVWKLIYIKHRGKVRAILQPITKWSWLIELL